MAAPHFLSPLLKKDAPASSRPSLVIDRAGGPGGDITLATDVETAFDSATRKRGLLGRMSLGEDAALVIAPCGGVHTFRMQFAIDVVFVARSGRVVKIAHAVRPGRIALALSAFAAIEVSAGRARRAGLQAGDRLVVRTGTPGAPAASPC